MVLSRALPMDSAQLCKCCGEGQHNLGMMPGSPKAWEGRNLVNACLNEASKESIGIYAKSRCQ